MTIDKTEQPCVHADLHLSGMTEVHGGIGSWYECLKCGERFRSDIQPYKLKVAQGVPVQSAPPVTAQELRAFCPDCSTDLISWGDQFADSWICPKCNETKTPARTRVAITLTPCQNCAALERELAEIKATRIVPFESHRQERDKLRRERDALRELLRDLNVCYENQTEQRYCICGNNDEGSHSYACLTQMRVQDRVSAALATSKPAPTDGEKGRS